MRTHSATIDWLSYTVPWNTEALARFGKVINLELIATALTNDLGPWLVQPSRNHYPFVVCSATTPGLSVMAAEADSGMGVHVSWSGSALREVNPRAVLRNALNMGANITRIDLAIDIPSEPYWEALEQQLVDGDAVTRARDHAMIRSRRGRTLYVGSRTSEKFLRIYDKAAEQGSYDPLTRIELECKGDFARGIAIHVDGAGYEYFADIIKGFCDFPAYGWWVEWMTSPTLLEGIPKAPKMRDTYAWLMRSVAPSVAKLIAADHQKFVSFLSRVYTLAGVESGVGEADPFDGAADWEPRPRH